eukprot:3089814-Amphidinium_carterae.1
MTRRSHLVGSPTWVGGEGKPGFVEAGALACAEDSDVFTRSGDSDQGPVVANCTESVHERSSRVLPY